jgi:cytoskeletal protein CcmA (bactofilin family)
LVAGLKLVGHVQVPEPVRKDGAFIDSFVITGNVSSEENVSVYGCSFIGIVSVDGTE